MSQLEQGAAEIVAGTARASSAYVPPLQRTAGQPPPIAANDGCPSGEAMTSPVEGTAEGVFVADSFGQAVYLNGGGPPLSLLEDPIRLEFRAGRCINIDVGRAARRLEAVLSQATDDNARMLAELGLGTNPFAREIGHVENQFRLGTAHIALGDNHLIGWRGTHIYCGTLVSDMHVDLVANSISIEIDGQPVLA